VRKRGLDGIVLGKPALKGGLPGFPLADSVDGMAGNRSFPAHLSSQQLPKAGSKNGGGGGGGRATNPRVTGPD